MNNKKIIRVVTVSGSLVFYTSTNQTLKDKGYEVILLSSPGPELEEIQNEDIRTIAVPMERHISLKNDFKSLLQLVKVFRKEKQFIVHSMTQGRVAL